MRSFATYTAADLARITATPLTMGVALGDEFPDGEYVAYPWLRYVEQQVLASLYRPGNEIIIVSVPFQVGKAVSVDEDLLTANRGWIKMRDVAVGDAVFAPDGTTTPVTRVHPIAWSPNGCYRVTTTDGRKLDVNGDHVWRVDVRGKGRKGALLTTKELAESWLHKTVETKLNGRTYHTKRYRYALPAPVHCATPNRYLPVDPYTLGVWLGDGTAAGNSLTLNENDAAEIASYLDGTMTWLPRPNHHVVQGSVRMSNGKALRRHLDDLGLLENKHIPDVFLSAGSEQRLALLRGLMDTDGYSGNGKAVELCFTNERLARDAYHLCLSLGYRANIGESAANIDGRYVSQRWRIQFTLQPGQPNPFRLRRKADSVKVGRGSLGCSIASVERIPDRQTRCITVGREDGMFLAGRHLVPTHNSSYFSLLFPAWYLGRYPQRTWLNISYNDDRAKAWGRASRNLLRRHGPKLFGVNVDIESDSAGEWHFAGQQGGMISSGIRSTVNGITANVISLDDTLKGMEEANSPPVKRRNMDEFDSVIMGRCQSNPAAPTKIFIINTRLVEDDIGGELLDRARQPGYDGFPVTLINIKAIAEPDPEEMADMTEEQLAEWRDCLGRKFGEPLDCRHTPEFFRLRKASMPAGMWMSQYQGIPTFSEASMFPEHHWRFWVHDEVGEKLPEDTFLPKRLAKRVRVWDLAASEGGGDWTVGTLLGLSDDGRVFILERERFQHAPGGVEERVKSMAQQDGYEVAIRIEQERQGSGITTVDHYKRELIGYDIDGIKAEGVKESRATPYSIMQNGNKVYLPRHADWTAGWIKEHAQMDGKGKRPKHDDQIDTAAYGVKYLVGTGTTEIFDPNFIGSNRADLTDDERLDAMLVRQMLGLD